jgi:group I intron endonuclease
MYIYKITNKVNRKLIVGKTEQNPELRRRQHFSKLRRNSHYNKYLQRAWNKYGEEHFTFEVIEHLSAGTNSDLNSLEKHWINFFDSMNPEKGYNLTEGGDGGKMCLESLIKMKETKKQRYASGEVVVWNKGKRTGHTPWNK